MTKGNFKILTCFVFSIIILLSCNKTQDNDQCLSYIKASIIKVEGPNKGTVNQEINFTVSFGCSNGCGQFGNFEQTSDNDTTTINVIAKYEGCNCTLDAPIRQTIYKFKATQTGTYYLKFWQTDKSYLLDSLIIQ